MRRSEVDSEIDLDSNLRSAAAVLHEDDFSCYVPLFANTAPLGLHFARSTPAEKVARLEIIDWNRPFAPERFEGPFFFYAQWEQFLALEERARGTRRGGSYYHEVVSRYRIRELFVRRGADRGRGRDLGLECAEDMECLYRLLEGRAVEVYSDTRRQAQEVVDILSQNGRLGARVYRMFEAEEMLARVREVEEGEAVPIFVVSGPMAKLLSEQEERFIRFELPDEIFGHTKAFELLACWFLPHRMIDVERNRRIHEAIRTYHDALFEAARAEKQAGFGAIVKGYRQLSKLPLEIFRDSEEYARCLERHHTYA